MKKNLTLLAFLLAIAFHGLAQDTLSGVVSRVAAPFFEQNVCDTRFAINTDNETYYVMVDGYWPNPYLEDLVIHYDTIPVGNEIEVVGTIMQMEDGNGEEFYTIVVNENLNTSYQQILGFFSNNDGAYFYHYNGLNGYHITINGEFQTTPFVINGRTLLEGKRYLFVGISNEGVFELFDALPYDVEDVSIIGELTMENGLHLSSPSDEIRFLSLFDGEHHYYLTQKRKLQNTFVNDAAFMEADTVVVGGFEIVRHDLFGAPFKTLEIIELQSVEKRSFVGGMNEAGIPYINPGPPIPGVDLVLHSDGVNYYIINPHDSDVLNGFYVVENDTIPTTSQQITATCTPRMLINNYLNPYYQVHINKVDFDEHEEVLHCTLAIEDNPFYFGNMPVLHSQDGETYYLKPYIYGDNAPDHIVIGDQTIFVGDSFTAKGIVSLWYANNTILMKVIDLVEANNHTELNEGTPSDTQVNVAQSNGMVEIVAGQSINSIIVTDIMGRRLIKKTCKSHRVSLDLSNYTGLLIFQVSFENGYKTAKKVVL